MKMKKARKCINLIDMIINPAQTAIRKETKRL